MVLVAAAIVPLNFWQMFKLGGARKKHGIKYPKMYSEKNEEFNCFQRAHQNTLEVLPFFITNLLLGGLRHPCLSAIAGTGFLISRVMYANGYYTGKPENRVPGAKGTFASLILLFLLAVSTGAGILEYW